MEVYWMSQKTGELVFSRRQLVRTIFEYIFHYGFLDLTWKKEVE